MTSSNLYTISLGSISTNVAALKNHTHNTMRIMAIIKASAYGCMMLPIAQHLVDCCGINCLGVSRLHEALILRKVFPKTDIFIIKTLPWESDKIVHGQFMAAVDTPEMIEALKRSAEKMSLQARVHLHVDTGMSRFGCHRDEALKLAQSIEAEPSLNFEGLFTHFAKAEDPKEDAFTLMQFHRFKNVLDSLKNRPQWIHASNSAATIRFAFTECNMLRIGLALYGVASSSSCHETLPLNLALKLSSTVLAINHYQRGDTVSYGGIYEIQEEKATLATVGIGYHDGLHRHYSLKGYVLIHGQKAPITGRITMEFMMVDVSNIQGVKIGDPVIIFGKDSNEELYPENFALNGGSIGHELITCIGAHIPRIFIN